RARAFWATRCGWSGYSTLASPTARQAYGRTRHDKAPSKHGAKLLALHPEPAHLLAEGTARHLECLHHGSDGAVMADQFRLDQVPLIGGEPFGQARCGGQSRGGGEHGFERAPRRV